MVRTLRLLIDCRPFHPREMFADALSDRASAVSVPHNHPIGGLENFDTDRLQAHKH